MATGNISSILTNSTVPEEAGTVEDISFYQIHDVGGLMYFAAFCIIVFIVVGVSGNALTIIALVRCPRIRSTTSAFIISLCFADACFCTINLPFTASRFINKEWIHGHSLCVVFPFVRYSNVAVSLLSIVAISVNRFILIAYPKIYHKVYQKWHIAAMISSCWLFSFMMLIPTLIGKWGRFGYDPSIGNCSIIPVNGKSAKKFLFIAAFVVPSIVIVSSYTGIFWRVRESNERMRKHSSSANDKKKEKKRKRDEWKITCMVLVIFISFVVCYLPITIMKVTGIDKKSPTLYVLGYLLIYMSACVNPIIYVIMNKQYRQAYKTIIFCRRPRSKSISSHKSGQTPSASGESSNATKNTMVSPPISSHSNAFVDEKV